MREMQTLTRSDEYLKIVEGDDAESIELGQNQDSVSYEFSTA